MWIFVVFFLQICFMFYFLQNKTLGEIVRNSYSRCCVEKKPERPWEVVKTSQGCAVVLESSAGGSSSVTAEDTGNGAEGRFGRVQQQNP